MNTSIQSSNKPSWLRYAAPFLLIGIASLSFVLFSDKNPVLIGFVAQMTGNQAELGVQERNGVQLAVEKINASGGINGRKIELVIRDDLGIPGKAQSVDDELIKAGVVAIIGHATSGQTIAGLKVTNPARMIMISPTVSTPELSGQDDFFFRVYPTFKDSSQTFAEYIFKTAGLKRLAVIYDMDNAAYAKTYSTIFSEKYASLGGIISCERNFSSKARPDFFTVLSELRRGDAEGLMIIASDIDAALIAQRVRIMDWQVPLFTSAWAQTETLITNGGKAVDGLKLEQSYALTSQSPQFTEFKSSYQARFGNTPSFGAAFGYEAALVLADALKKTDGKPDKLKKALLETRDFKGLMDNISLDQFGDVQRPFYLSAIENGRFVILGKLN